MATPRFTDDEQWLAEQLTNCKTDADWDALGPSLQAEICELVERRPDVFERSSRAGTLRSNISDLSHLSQLPPTPSIPNPLFRSKYADTVNRGFWDAEADRPTSRGQGSIPQPQTPRSVRPRPCPPATPTRPRPRLAGGVNFSDAMSLQEAMTQSNRLLQEAMMAAVEHETNLNTYAMALEALGTTGVPMAQGGSAPVGRPRRRKPHNRGKRGMGDEDNFGVQ